MGRKYIGTTPRVVMQIEKIYTIHYFEYIKNFCGIGEAHNFWEMVYVDCGQIQITAGDALFPLAQGEAYLHAPNEYHNIVSANAFSSVFIISFSTGSRDAGYLKGCKCIFSEWEKELVSMILRESPAVFAGSLDIMDQTQLARNNGAPYGGEQVVKMLLEHLLISIVRNNLKGKGRSAEAGRNDPVPAKRNDRYIVDTIINILVQNLYQKVTLDDICQKVMFSKSYIGKIFKENMGCGVINYFNRLKTNEAKRLISEGEQNFTAIAEMLNFGSLHYFSRTFKAFVGMNPSEYAKSVKARGLL